MSHLMGLVNKAFGSLCYAKELSEYKADYRIKSLEDSIEEMEKMIDATRQNDQKVILQTKTEKKMKLCLISSSGGHYEQLRMLKRLEDKYDLFWVTEKTDYKGNADYYLSQTGLNDVLVPFKLVGNCFKTLRFWLKEKPQAVITTGTIVALPACLIAKFCGKKLIYIETFARVRDCTRMGKLMYKIADLFIYQWEYLKEFYPDGIYGGGIY